MQIKRILRKTQKRRRKICFFRVMFLSLQKSELWIFNSLLIRVPVSGFVSSRQSEMSICLCPFPINPSETPAPSISPCSGFTSPPSLPQLHTPAARVILQFISVPRSLSPGLWPCQVSPFMLHPASFHLAQVWLRCGSPRKSWALVSLLSVPIACRVLCTVLSASTTTTSSSQVGHGGRGWPSFGSFLLAIHTTQNTCLPGFSSLAHSYPLSLMCNIISLEEFSNLQPML